MYIHQLNPYSWADRVRWVVKIPNLKPESMHTSHYDMFPKKSSVFIADY